MEEGVQVARADLFDLRVDPVDRTEPGPVHVLDVRKISFMRRLLVVCRVGVRGDHGNGEPGRTKPDGSTSRRPQVQGGLSAYSACEKTTPRL